MLSIVTLREQVKIKIYGTRIFLNSILFFDFTQDNEVFIAAITAVEIIAAISRRARSGSISNADATLVCNQFRNDLQTDYQIVEITEEIINSGML